MRPDAATARNQPLPLVGYDLFTENRPLVEALRREGGGAWEEPASTLGVELGGEALEWGRLANVNPPLLHSYDRYGERLDEVEFHPAWHSLMALGIRSGLHALPWRDPRPGAHVARAAMFVTYSQVEQGSGCPISMTNAAVPALRVEPEIAAEWEPRLASLSSEPRLLPAAEKGSALCGMAMTEKRGGSDVRANESVAKPLHADGEYLLTGHKWFCSAPMCDAFLVREATHHAAHRVTFGRRLLEQPAMANVLADLSIESEAATAMALRVARTYDEGDANFGRLAIAVAKYWVCKRAPEHVAEALECVGGNGYVEESVLPRLYREAPVNSIWEGAGNIQCLDALRAARKQPESLDAFLAEVMLAEGSDRRLDAALAKLRAELGDPDDLELRARRIVERLATCLQGALLIRHAPHEIADAFCATRLDGDGRSVYGTLPRGIDHAAIVERHRPAPREKSRSTGSHPRSD